MKSINTECQRMKYVKLSNRSVPMHRVVSSLEPDASGPGEEPLPECGGVLHRLLDSLLELLQTRGTPKK